MDAGQWTLTQSPDSPPWTLIKSLDTKEWTVDTARVMGHSDKASSCGHCLRVWTVDGWTQSRFLVWTVDTGQWTVDSGHCQDDGHSLEPRAVDSGH